jgi:hypothetical protein
LRLKLALELMDALSAIVDAVIGFEHLVAVILASSLIVLNHRLKSAHNSVKDLIRVVLVLHQFLSIHLL